MRAIGQLALRLIPPSGSKHPFDFISPLFPESLLWVVSTYSATGIY